MQRVPIHLAARVGSREALFWHLVLSYVAFSFVSAVSPVYYAPDGANLPSQPALNRAGTALRAAPVLYADNVSSMPASAVSARHVSNSVFRGSSFAAEAGGLSALTVDFALLVAHDLAQFAPGQSVESVSFAVPLCDASFDAGCTGIAELYYSRVASVNGTGTNASNPRRALNAQTGWLDGSAVYGASSSRLSSLRTASGGLVYVDADAGAPARASLGRCPPTEPPPPTAPLAGLQTPGSSGIGGSSCASERLCGDSRCAAWPGVLALHGLFLSEHNRVARALAAANPSWSDERLFQEARKRVVATLQAIVAYELLPALVGGSSAANAAAAAGAGAAALSPLGNYSGYNASVDPRIGPAFAAGVLPMLLSGLNSVALCIGATGEPCSVGHLPLRDAAGSPGWLDWVPDGGGWAVLRGAALAAAGAVDTAVVPDIRCASWHDGASGDLMANAIMRGRDLGVPPFAAVRRDLGLPDVQSWAGITGDVRAQAALAAAYGNAPSAVELLPGLLAEATGAAAPFSGATARTLLLDGFGRLRDGDRMWFENAALTDLSSGRAVRYLSDADIAAARATRLGDVLARNVPSWPSPQAASSAATVTAAGSGGSSVQSAFVTRNIVAPAFVPAPSPTAGPAAGSGISRTAVVNSVITLSWIEPHAAAAAANPRDTNITLTLRFAGTGWVSIAFGTSSMTTGDCILMRILAGGRGEVLDTRLSGYGMPPTDARQDVTLLSATQVDGVSTFVLRRPLSTGDPDDVDIGFTSLPVVFAWHPTSTTYGAHPGTDDSGTIQFLTPPA